MRFHKTIFHAMTVVGTELLVAGTIVAQGPSMPMPQSQREEMLPHPSRDESGPPSNTLPPAPWVAPPLPAGPAPTDPPIQAVLRPGEKVTLRIRQVLPADGLSPAERLLNSRDAVRPGDRFLAEVVEPRCPSLTLVGGTIAKVVRPGLFGRPGYVTLQFGQVVETVDGQMRVLSWQIDLADRSAATRLRRALLTVLFGLEGAGIGAAVGAQDPNAPAAPVAVAAGAGLGLVLGLGYASLQRGQEASLEPGDTFRIVVGTTSYRPLPRETRTMLYPASGPSEQKGSDK